MSAAVWRADVKASVLGWRLMAWSGRKRNDGFRARPGKSCRSFCCPLPRRCANQTLDEPYAEVCPELRAGAGCNT